MKYTLVTRHLSLLFLGATTLYSNLAAAQNDATVLDSSRLPSCAMKCQVLTSANAQCVPPTAPATSQNQYQACYCAAQTLTGLYSSPDGVSCQNCNGQDMQAIQQWYVNLCTKGNVVTPGTGSGGQNSGNDNSNDNNGGDNNGQPTQTGSDSSQTTDPSATGTSSGQTSNSSKQNNNQSW
jgi:hypothetical protein